jgi:signal peptidase II
MLKKYLKLTLIAGIVVLLDQLSKALIVKVLPLHSARTVIDGFFNLVHIHNPGGAFGLMAGMGPAVRTTVFLIVSAMAVGLILYFYHTTPADRPWLATGFAMIFGGAVGNMIDRVRMGAVVDFLDFHIGGWHWPAFNVADSAITVGVGVFVLHVVLRKTTI